MSAFPSFNESHLEMIARTLGEAVTGTQLTNLFITCGIKDISSESTKWKRIYHSLLERQKNDKCGNNVAAFITTILSPGRFIGRNDVFEKTRRELNAVLLFDGLELSTSGDFQRVTAAKTVSEAEQRSKILTAKLKDRTIHREVWAFCTPELLHDNFFHAVFEATKSLAERIRQMTGLHSDGSALVDEAFSLKNPRLAFNSIETESEQSEHKGFAMLLKGCFSAVRNPLAHDPKILWKGEEDAADYLTLISLLHRKLDEAVVVPQKKRN